LKVRLWSGFFIFFSLFVSSQTSVKQDHGCTYFINLFSTDVFLVDAGAQTKKGYVSRIPPLEGTYSYSGLKFLRLGIPQSSTI